jgi:hypothetical protein
MERASADQELRERQPVRAALVGGHEKPLVLVCPAGRSFSVPKNGTCFIG